MDKEEIKGLIPGDAPTDSYLDAVIPLILEWVEDYCNDDFLIDNPDYDEDDPDSDEEIKSYPGGVKLFVVEAIKMQARDLGKQSESLGDYSVSYQQTTTDYPVSMRKMLTPYRKMGW